MTHICLVRDDWMGSLESAYLGVTSPSGKSLEVRKSRYWNKKLKGQSFDTSIINEIRGKVSEWIRVNDKIRSTYNIELSTAQMQRFKDFVNTIK